MALLGAALLTAAAAAASTTWTGSVDFTRSSKPFMGLGGLSGGGGTSRLLYDYAEPQRGQILDALFTPKQGGSLQILKVEVGGDGQSTEATEASHMHTRDDLNFQRGYEWWLMKEAKYRNPDVKLYGLTWAVPGWIGNGSFYEGDDNINYHINWIEGAKSAHNLTIDYLGVWNERNYDAGWIIRLRKALDSRGHEHVTIVAADTSFDVCNDFIKNKTLADAIGIVGAHYPITSTKPKPIPDSCHQLNKPLWTSEGWDLGQVNDFKGALSLAQTINYNWIVQQQTAMIVWTVIYAWYSILPFAHPDARDPIGGMGHGLMSADQPWGGHYRIMSPLYIMAHTTQYVSPGCTYIQSDQVMSGGLLNNSASMVAFACEKHGTVTIVVETSESAGEPVHLSTKVSLPAWAGTGPMHLRETCEDSWFKAKDELLTVERAEMAAESQDGDGPAVVSVSAILQPHCVYTISTATGQSTVPIASPAIPPPKRFPFPYKDTFDGRGYKDQGTVKYFTDQGGSFNAAPAPSSASITKTATGGMALHQVVDTRPIEWGHNPDPVTIAGDITWANYSISAACRIGSVSPLPAGPPAPPTPSPPAPPTLELFSVAAAKCDAAASAQKFRLKKTPIDGNVNGPRTAATTGGEQIVYDGGKGCLAATEWNTQWQTPVAGIGACNSSDPNQLWTVRGTKICLHSGCLNLDGGSTEPGTTILIWAGADPTANNEDWVLSSSGAVEYGTAAHPLGVCLESGPKRPPGPPPPPPLGPQPSATSVKICGRIGSYSRGGSPPNGYCLIVDNSKKWYLSNGGRSAPVREIESVIASGNVPATADDISAGWVSLKMKFEGNSITPSIGGTTLPTVTDSKWTAGMVGLGSGWNQAWFDDVEIAA